MLNVGLTGGIGSGKSAVAERLAALGAVILDADAVAREVVAPGSEGLPKVVEAFGPEVLRADGSLDRDKLAAVVFADDGQRERLNAIVHPLVGHRMLELLGDIASREPDAVVVHDVPLLVENDLRGRYDVVVVVDTDPETQVRRLVEQRGMAEADARARLAAQATRAQRLAAADIVIDNTGDLAALDRRVKEVWCHLAARAGRPMPR